MIFQPSDILAAREEKQQIIAHLKSPGKTIVTMKANIPGVDKRVKEAYVLLGLLVPKLPFAAIESIQTMDGADGPSVFFLVKDVDAVIIKNQAAYFEDSQVLGRMIDLDVFGEDGHSLSRGTLRKCYLCEKPAFVCAKEKNHSLDQLQSFLIKNVETELQSVIRKWIDFAILEELELDPKFGLVTPFSRGSHPDMDFDLMVRAKDSIIPFFERMFLEGYHAKVLSPLFPTIREIGKKAETRMLETTGGINAYKGLIFSLGLIVATSGYVLGNHLPMTHIFDSIREMTTGLMKELEISSGSFGASAFQRFGLGGARKEAYQGFPSIQKVLPMVTNSSKVAKTMALIQLIGLCEDTVLLKRAKTLEKYQLAKEKMAQISIYDEQRIQEVSTWCTEEGLSFGGAADLLIVTLFLHRLSSNFMFWDSKKVSK
jgi:holo-ACP synthase CitX